MFICDIVSINYLRLYDYSVIYLYNQYEFNLVRIKYYINTNTKVFAC